MTKLVAPLPPKKDKRLLGTWKSDRKRTLKEWTWTKRLSLTKRKKFASIFGKLEVTFMPGRMISKLRHRGWEAWRPYIVLAADDTSVAVLEFGDLRIKNARNYDRFCLELVKEACPKLKIHHINFDGVHYWVSLGKNREFFQKVSKRS